MCPKMCDTRHQYVRGSLSGPMRDVKSTCVLAPPVSVLTIWTTTQMNTNPTTTGELFVILAERPLFSFTVNPPFTAVVPDVYRS